MHATVRNFFFLVIFFLVNLAKALPMQGFSVSGLTLQKYLQQATQQKIWEDPRWILLGHFEKSFFSGYQSTFRGNLFIAENGFKSPQDEILETIKAFFSESKELTKKYKRHPQCQFLARRKWLMQKLSIAQADLLPCEERLAWKKQLNAKAVSLVFAASDLGNPASSYGHTFLKFVNPENAKNKDLIDYGINYAADADASEGFFYAVKGLFGMYDGVFTMLPYHQKLREYINLEGRDIWEYPLNLSEEEVDFFIDHLLEIEKTYSPYYFFSDNCSYQILKILEVVRPDLQLAKHFTSFVIPIDTIKVVRRYSPLSSDRVYKKSLKTDYLDGYLKLSDQQKDGLDVVLQNAKAPLNKEFSLKQKAEIYETAMKSYAIKAYRTGKDFDETLYQLSIERATLGSVTNESKIQNPQAPDDSHDSSAIYFGAGKDFYSFKFRAAFHDLEQPDFGTVHMSQTEMATLDFRYNTELKKFSLHQFTFLDLINLNPSNQLDRNISWKVRAEILDQWTPDLEVGGGGSFNLDLGQAARLGFFLTGEIKGRDMKAAGPEILAVLRPSQSIGVSVALTYFAMLEEKSFLRWKSKLNWNIRRNFDLQLEGQNQFHGDDEYQVRLVKNFLF